MAYATPAQYAQAFGLSEALQMLQDEEHTLTPEALQAGLVAIAAGAVVADAVAAAALARLQAKLDNTSNLMDGYLRAAVTLPLTAGQLLGTLQECCLALTRCLLADDTDNATERMDKCCDNWRAWLKDVAAGKVKLVDSDGEELGGGSSGRVVTGYVAPAYDYAAMAGFGGGYRS